MSFWEKGSCRYTIGGAFTYYTLGESALTGAYNGALIGAGFRIAYLMKGGKGVFDAFLNGVVVGTSRLLTELLFAYHMKSSDGRSDAEIVRTSALKGADSFASGVWSSAISMMPKTKLLEWTDSPIGKGFVWALDAAITSVWSDLHRTPVPDARTIADNAVTAATISAGSLLFKRALLDQVPDIPDEVIDDITRAFFNTVVNVLVGFDAKGIVGFVKFLDEF